MPDQIWGLVVLLVLVLGLTAYGLTDPPRRAGPAALAVLALGVVLAIVLTAVPR